MQRTHYNSEFEKRIFPIHLICDDVQNGLNIGGILRISDAMGIEHLYICGDRTELDRTVKRTSRSSEKYVAHSFHSSVVSVISKLKESGHRILALEITDSSKELSELKLNKEEKVAIIIGDENFGISEEALKLSDEHVYINMFGQNSSMNVVQATSIALYSISQRFV